MAFARLKSAERAPILSAYRALLENGDVANDPAQEALVEGLAQLQQVLVESSKRRTGWGKRAFLAKHSAYRGAYVFGDVGRGKTFLMDLFFETTAISKKRRVHFHAFMQEVHQWLFSWRSSEQSRVADKQDLLSTFAAQLAKEISVLCFDELQILDIADAMLVGRLFEALLENGVFIVITSNRVPEDLYKDGIQRESFLPFIAFLRAHFWIHHLEAPTDYRMQHLKSLRTTYFTPLGAEADRFMAESFALFSHHAAPRAVEVMVNGRKLTFAYCAQSAMWCDFKELCAQPLAASDYLAIVAQFKTILISNIPIFSPEQRNEAKRFVTLTDILYEHRTLLICSAAAAPSLLYPKGSGTFEFARTASRLTEMQGWGDRGI